MARKKAIRRLPPLTKAPPLGLKDHKAERLLEILRGITVATQRDDPQPFYALREVATRFQVPISTVARAYRQLEDEGVLSSIRGSKTVLQGFDSTRRLSVRGVVGMPASVARFVTIQDYRTFFIRTRRELRLRDFATATVFFDRSNESSDRFVQRAQKYKLDTVLWYLPDPAANDIASRLNDLGIHVVGVGDGSLTSLFCRYEVRREAAVIAILRDWKSSSGIKSATIARGPKSAAYEERLEAILDNEDIGYETASPGIERIEIFLDSLGNDKKRGIIFLSSAASFFSFRAPEALARLLSRTRVAFVGGPASVPFAKASDARVDLVVTDWQLVAERIVSDLISKDAFGTKRIHVFEAQHHLQVPLTQYAQSL